MICDELMHLPLLVSAQLFRGGWWVFELVEDHRETTSIW